MWSAGRRKFGRRRIHKLGADGRGTPVLTRALHMSIVTKYSAKYSREFLESSRRVGMPAAQNSPHSALCVHAGGC